LAGALTSSSSQTRDVVQMLSGTITISRPAPMGKRMSSGSFAFGTVSPDEQICSNFGPFSYPIGSAISASRAARYAANATPIGLRSGSPAPLNRPGCNSRPALLPGPAAHLSFTCQAGSRTGAEAAAVLRRLFGERKLKRPSASLAPNKRHIRFPGHYPASPEAPLSKLPDRIWIDQWSLRLAPPAIVSNRRMPHRGQGETS
jgi:hypothetical protein